MYDNSYNSTDYSSGTSSTLDTGVLVAIIIGTIIFALIVYVITSIFMGMVFKKAGVAPWKAWVPVYNQWVFLELGEQKGWISLLFLLGAIPLVGPIIALVAYVFSCIAAYRVGLNFGKEGVFVLLYIFLSPVWLIWLAVDKTAVWKSAPTTVGGTPTPPTSTPPESPAGPSQPAAM